MVLDLAQLFLLATLLVGLVGPLGERDASIGAHQIASQLWIFLALILDSVAIAGQIIVGQELGAARPDEAFDASVRMIWLSIAVGTALAVVLLYVVLIVGGVAAAALVVVGGITRLTESGLSITEWQPLLGAIPPLNEADWQAAFEKYKAIPEYSIVNAGIDRKSVV